MTDLVYDIIYLDDKNNVVDKNKAVKYEQYKRDKSGNVIQRIYGILKPQKNKQSGLFADA